jgi:hypothetical protein
MTYNWNSGSRMPRRPFSAVLKAAGLITKRRMIDSVRGPSDIFQEWLSVSHAGNRGSKPLRGANKINGLVQATISVSKKRLIREAVTSQEVSAAIFPLAVMLALPLGSP